MPMLTTEVRKKARAAAIWTYDRAGGSLLHTTHNLYVNPEIGLNSEDDLIQIEEYLVSSGIIERPYMQRPRDFRFTKHGISVIEASIDQPTETVGPFPPITVSIQGNVGPGSQLVIGSHHVTQSTQTSQSEGFVELIRLVEKVVADLPKDIQGRGGRLEEMMKEEVASPVPDRNLINTLACRLGTLVNGVTTSVGSQMFLAYLKQQGLLP